MTTITTWEEMFGESSGKSGLKMTNKTHTDERKIISTCSLNLYLSIRVRQYGQVSKHQKSRTILWLFKARWCDQTYFFRRTAKNLVAYATSWSLTLSPGQQYALFSKLQKSAAFLTNHPVFVIVQQPILPLFFVHIQTQLRQIGVQW